MAFKIDPNEWENWALNQEKYGHIVKERIEANKHVTDGIYINPITGVKVSIDELYDVYINERNT